MDLKKLIKMLEVETDKEKIDKIIQKIDSLIIKKGFVRMGPHGYLKPLEIQSHICKRDAFEKGYFDFDTWNNNRNYPVRPDCIYIQPDYSGIEIVLPINEQYAVSCLVKSAHICLYGNGINAPAASQKKIGEFFKKLGAPRSQYNNCHFYIINKQKSH